MHSVKIHSYLNVLIDGQSLREKVTCLGIALLIIAEHSYFFWDQNRDNNPAYFTMAMILYKESGNYMSVIQAVKQAFEEDGDASFGFWAMPTRQAARNTLNHKLLRIVMDYRLSKDNLDKQLEKIREINQEDWMKTWMPTEISHFLINNSLQNMMESSCICQKILLLYEAIYA
ncbi:hypothetical protein M422DRAFT_55770 [Sphaerobolus stellatus SS14]|uniref:Uncharacterized protein n=1 Tax=Sphaerobolus stellatus (strain SS14) TaxID=990650 RepID=A0A0C9UKE1_SPHS4|nr:hypothetical protein M422DRAFT_55770 [Sphaerobolus stellatus SS14]